VKAKLIWLTLPVLVLATISALIFWPKPKPVSPLSDFTPDVSAKLKTRLATPPNLDSTDAKITPKVNIPHYLVFNLDTGRVYLASGAAQRIAPASFTKVLTAAVALDLGYPDQLLTTTKSSVDRVPTVLGLRVGEQLVLSDLLRAAIATSANDAAATIAEGIAIQNGHNLAGFLDLMNQKAALLGMADSHFNTPDGLDDSGQFTTLIDMAKLVQQTAINYPEILKAAASNREDIILGPTHAGYYLSNWNGLLGLYTGVFGLKIAYTEAAGYSTIVLSNRNDIRLAVLLTGADSLIERDTAAALLLDEAFVAEGLPRVNLSQAALKRQYKIWDDFIKETRAALKNSN
jgi:D-alanyl-D-alanine carboxypeptidase